MDDVERSTSSTAFGQYRDRTVHKLYRAKKEQHCAVRIYQSTTILIQLSQYATHWVLPKLSVLFHSVF